MVGATKRHLDLGKGKNALQLFVHICVCVYVETVCLFCLAVSTASGTAARRCSAVSNFIIPRLKHEPPPCKVRLYLRPRRPLAYVAFITSCSSVDPSTPLAAANATNARACRSLLYRSRSAFPSMKSLLTFFPIAFFFLNGLWTFHVLRRLPFRLYSVPLSPHTNFFFFFFPLAFLTAIVTSGDVL